MARNVASAIREQLSSPRELEDIVLEINQSGGTADKALICLRIIKPEIESCADQNDMETGQWRSP